MVAVISASGKKLMPTTNAKARKLIKSGRAKPYAYRPIFTIVLTERKDGDTQPVEYCCDTGYKSIGISIKTKKREIVNEQRDLLSDESGRHKDRCKYRRTRRNRKRYRKARWKNRKSLISKDGFAPSIRNRRDMHIAIFKAYWGVLPITEAVFEMGQFDIQVLKAIEEGNPLPEGTNYQEGERYGYATLREAVFARDNYTCQCCGRSIKDHAILKIHHKGYLKGDRSNRMANLLTVCELCHTAKNHKPGGRLYDPKPVARNFKGASFMTSVRFDMFEKLKKAAPDVQFHMTYGAATKMKRGELGIPKSHSNDAYCMGSFHPKHRACRSHYKKARRNNRILSKFYDAKYIDIRDGKKKSASQLGCNRPDRSIPRANPNNERMFRGQKVSKGRVSIRRRRYGIRPGDKVLYNGTLFVAKGMQNSGTYVSVEGRTPIAVKKLTVISHINGWIPVC